VSESGERAKEESRSAEVEGIHAKTYSMLRPPKLYTISIPSFLSQWRGLTAWGIGR
jgi:hypothetical protein